MFSHTHPQIRSVITGLTACVRLGNSVAPLREDPGNQALYRALRLQQGTEVEGTGSESHFERG